MTGAAPAALDAAWSAALSAWQRRHGRHGLPWKTRDPYRIWLSEVMLQQTQVSTVLRHYGRFLERFPDVATLAAAPLDDVLAAWSGLGYYRRARLLHAGARFVVDQHAGVFPRTQAELIELPGVGRSTAAAIAVFSADAVAAILDGNVRRVLARVLGFEGDLGRAGPLAQLWAIAEQMVDRADPAAYTQGLMDLGATVCTPRRPDCARCPWAEPCVARAVGDPERYPIASRKLARTAIGHALLLVRRGSSLLLVQRPAEGIWAGLWTLPLLEPGQAPPELPGAQAAVAGAPFVHVLTHRDWRMEPWQVRVDAHTARDAITTALAPCLAASTFAADADGQPLWRWATRSEALTLALPTPIRRLIAES